MVSKKVSVGILLCLISCVLHAAPEAIRITDRSLLYINDQLFELVHYSLRWKTSFQNNGVLAAPNALCKEKDVVSFSGKFKVTDGTFDFSESLHFHEENQADFSWEMKNEAGVPTNLLHFRTLLPLDDILQNPISADGVPLKLRASFDEKNMRVDAKNVHLLKIPMRNAALLLEGQFNVQLQDNRKWKSNKGELRIFPKQIREGKRLKHASLKLKITVQPYRNNPIPLNKVANMGFRDEKPGDGLGGWTDEGPQNDLRTFPVGKQKFGDVLFEIVNPEKNKNKSCIVLRGPTRPLFPENAEIVLDRALPGKYLYVLNAVGWERPGKTVGNIVVEYDKALFVNKETAIFSVKSGTDTANFWTPRWLANAVVGWNGFNPAAEIGLYLTCFELTGAPIRKITFESAGNMVWMIAGVTLSEVPPKIVPQEGVTTRPDKDWAVLRNRIGVKPGSILDFSDFNDAPAGKYGHVTVRNGHFEFVDRPGIPVRFNGANLCGALPKDNKTVDRMADEFASMGYNLVRLHHYDQIIRAHKGKSTGLTPYFMERFDYVLYAFKKRGIYATIDLYTQRKPEKGEIPGYDGESLKTLTYVNDDARKNIEEFAANWLNHVNVYTKTAWKDEPAIASISIINENTIYMTMRTASPVVRSIYEKRFETWLKERNRTVNDQNRDMVYRHFLSETYLAGFHELEKFLRDLGVKVPVTDQNLRNMVPLSALRNHYDYVDNHSYWSHPSFLEKLWRLPVIVSGRSAIERFAGPLPGIFPTRLYGKPFTVSEWCFCFPNKFYIEGSFLTSAYAALQDWDALCIFTYSHGVTGIENEQSIIGWFDIVGDPMRKLSERAANCLYLRGDVAKAKKEFPVLIDSKYWEHENGIYEYPTAVERLGLVSGMGTVVAERNAVPVLPANTKAVLTLPGPAWKTKFPVSDISGVSPDLHQILFQNNLLSQKELDLKQSRFLSDTGELLLDCKKNQFSVVTPRSEAFVLEKDQTITGKFARVRNMDCFSACFLTAKDSRTLQKSDRILILHLTDTKSSGTRFRDRDMTIMETKGNLPTLIRRGKVDLTIQRDLSKFKLFAVDFDGSRMYEVPMKIAAGKSTFRLETEKAGKVTAAYELVRE